MATSLWMGFNCLKATATYVALGLIMRVHKGDFDKFDPINKILKQLEQKYFFFGKRVRLFPFMLNLLFIHLFIIFLS